MNLPLQNAQVLHIFAPWREPYSSETWREQILGNAMKSWAERNRANIPWFWFTSYSFSTSNNRPHDCEVPPEYLAQQPNGLRHRMLAVRLGDLEQAITQDLIDSANQAGCFPCIRAYDVVDDLGKNRFIHEDASEEERMRRAQLITGFLWYTSALVLDSLVAHEEGSWRSEGNTDKENPLHSFFESVHHLFCNATSVPTSVLVRPIDNKYPAAFTYWNSNCSVVKDNDEPVIVNGALVLRIGY